MNALLVLWVASLQIKSSRNKSFDKNYDPIELIKSSSKKAKDSIKPFIVSFFLVVASIIFLYYEMQSVEPISRMIILKMGVLISLLFSNIVLMVCTWYRLKAYTLAGEALKSFSGAFTKPSDAP